jgi:hypothetical protein
MARNEVSLLLSLYAGAVAPTKSAAEKFKGTSKNLGPPAIGKIALS